MKLDKSGAKFAALALRYQTDLALGSESGGRLVGAR